MSNAFWVYGSSFQIGDGATPENFATVAEVRDMTAPSFQRDTIEVTNQDSSGGFREFIAGWRDAGEVTLELNWLPGNATHDESTGLLSHYLDDEVRNYKLILPDTVLTIAFAGVITDFPPDLALESQGTVSVTIKITGEPTFS